MDDYRRRVPLTPWRTDYASTYRLFMRRRLSLSGERTLIAAICPLGVAHVHPVLGLAVRSAHHLSLIAAQLASVVFDFYIKITGRGDVYFETLANIPLITDTRFHAPLTARALMLNCLNVYYENLCECFDEEFLRDSGLNRPTPPSGKFTSLTPEWTWDTPLDGL